MTSHSPLGKEQNPWPQELGAVWAAQEPFQNLLESLSEGVLLFTPQGQVAWANPAAVELFRYTPGEITTLNWSKLFPGLKNAPVPTEPVRREAMILDKFNTLLPVQLRLLPQRGEKTGWFAALFSTDPSRQGGNPLEGADEKLVSAVLDTSGALVVVLDDQGRVVYLNLACQELTGFAPEEVRNRHILEVLQDPTDVDALRESLWKLKKGEHLFRFESTWITKRAEARRITWTNARLSDSQGSFNYIICTGVDITERKRAEDALRFTQFAVDRAEEAIFWVDEEGRFRYVNEAACRYLQFSKADLEGRRLQEVATHIPLGRWNSLWRVVQEKGAFTFEGVLRDSNGREFPVEILANFLSAGDQEYVCAFARDLTDRKRSEAALRESEEKYRKLAEAAGDAMMVMDAETAVIVDANHRAEVLFGLSRVDLVGRMCQELHPPEAVDACRLFLESCKNGEAPGQVMQMEVLHQNGKVVPVEVSASVVDVGGRRLVQSILRDITQRIEADRELRMTRERYMLSTQATFDGIFDWDIPGNQMFYSTRWKAMLGYDEDEIGAMPQEWLSRVHPHDQVTTEAALTAHLEGATPHFENEHRLRHKDGSFRWVLCRGPAVRDDAGHPVRMAGFLTDITERKRAEEQMQRNALLDGLTGLASWTLFVDRLGQALWRSKRSGGDFFAVLFVDIDNFRLLNDSFGYKKGDEVLRLMAARLRECVRPGDTVGRFSGDEFTVLVEGLLDREESLDVVRRVQARLSEPVSLMGEEVFLTVSIGVALSRQKYDRPEEIIRDADLAMYRAKGLGPGKWAVFDEEKMASNSLSTVKLRTDMRRALARSEFRLHYQPIVHLAAERLVGFEALVRWQHPERGLLGPLSFIPMAEETHLIHELGQWVMDEACRQIHIWRSQLQDEDLFVSVNLSATQFKESDLVDRVLASLKNAGLAPTGLWLELTESVMMENQDTAEATLRSLREAGVGLSLDDFGTGYSSLSYLHRFPLNALKIDRSFVQQLGRTQGQAGITDVILALAKQLNMKVVAEGVEEEMQAARLLSQGCDFAQGYFFARPLEADKAWELLRRQGKEGKAPFADFKNAALDPQC